MISIHASAREATHPVSSKLLFHLISIHASAREATSRTFSLRPISHDFNPRLREGGDRLPLAILLESCHFNPRLREGGDNIPSHPPGWVAHFNPRLREGGDLLRGV